MPAYEAQAEARIHGWIEGASIRIRIREEKLLRFLRDGRYKTMAETAESGGGMTRIDQRLKAEEQILGLPIDSDPSLRPISAYLSGSDEAGEIATYGDIVLDVSDAIRSRTWFLLDLVDTPVLSGGQVIAPVPLVQPSIDAVSYKCNVLRAETRPDACGGHRYAEALMFGGLRTDELVAISYPADGSPADEVVKLSADAPWDLKTSRTLPAGGTARRRPPRLVAPSCGRLSRRHRDREPRCRLQIEDNRAGGDDAALTDRPRARGP